MFQAKLITELIIKVVILTYCVTFLLLLLDPAEPKEAENKADVQDYRGGGWRGGGGYPGGGYPGGGWRGGGGYPGGGHGGYCRYGCCNRGYYGGCRCCSRPDQIPEPMYRPEFVEVHN